MTTIAYDVPSPTHRPYGLSLWGVGDRVRLETTVPPVLGKEIGRQVVIAPASTSFQVDVVFLCEEGADLKAHPAFRILYDTPRRL